MVQISSSLDAFSVLKGHFNPDSEELWILALNSQLKVIAKDMLFRGSVDRCLIHPRDIFRFSIKHNASAFILGHNHPSLDVHPSDIDIFATKKIHKLSLLLEIPMADHLIFTAEKYYSLADQGFIKNRIGCSRKRI